MAHYVILDDNNFVTNGHVGRNEYEIALDENGNTIDWEIYYKAKRTSYNTRGGVHYQPNSNTPSIDQSKSFRKNYAGLGYYYDEIRDAFIPPKPFESWILDEFSCLWNPPISYPNDGKMYRWNEDILNWQEINLTQ